MSKKNTPPKLGTENVIDSHLAEQPENAKTQSLSFYSADATGQDMTTNTGLRINDDQNSLKAGERGPSLLEDFILREKITHFDHERIPERVVHARGSGALPYT